MDYTYIYYIDILLCFISILINFHMLYNTGNIKYNIPFISHYVKGNKT